MKSVFEFSDYRGYLLDHLTHLPGKGRGVRRDWAAAASCQVAYVSHVLGGRHDFSPEQAEAVSRRIGHSSEEQEFFLLLVHKARAGTKSLQQFYKDRLAERLTHHNNLRNRMRIKENLNLDDQATYYSKWHFAAIHMILTIPKYQTAAAIAEYFALPLPEAKGYLDFLETRQLIENESGHYTVRGKFLHIGKDSPLFFSQQLAWRQRAISSIYRNHPDEVHFSSVFSIAESDVEKIRMILSRAIESSTEVIKPSKEEKLYSICLDFFEV